MKKTLLTLALAAGLISSSQAGTVFQTVSHTFGNSAPTSFYFSQFNSSLGTLTGISYSIVSSADSGTFYVENNNAGIVGVKSPKDYLTVADNQGGYANYDGNNTSILSDPATLATAPFQLGGNSSQTFTVTPKSLIGTGTIDTDLFAFNAAAYTGAGLVSFDATISPSVTVTGGSVTFDMSGVSNTTQMTMTYTYDTAPVPEPSQVAASMLLLGGFAGFVIIRRRKALVA